LDNQAFSGKVLVLERGDRVTQREQQAGQRSELVAQAAQSFDNKNPEKPWPFISALGGSSNCWVGNTPRMLPNDFKLRSTYGVGTDWPLTYDELEPYYCDAEEIMSISGPLDGSPFPRSRPYPQEAHGMSGVDIALQRGNPGKFFSMPTARPVRPTELRPACCSNGPCTLCPIDSKFTVLNELSTTTVGSRESW
jgi:choline dehydrogenase-like flavoprotein